MSNAVTLISGFLFYIIIVRMFDISTVGVVSLLNTTTGLFGIIFAFGLGYGLQHYISYFLGKGDYSNIKTLISRFLRITLGITFAAFAFLWLIAPLIASGFFHDQTVTILIRILGFNIASFIMIGIFNKIMLGLQNFKKSASLMAYAGISTYLYALVMAHFQKSPMMIVIGWSIGNVSAAILIGMSVLAESHKIHMVGNPDLRTKRIFMYSFPVFLASIIQFGANYIDRFVLAFFTNLSDVGIYNLATVVATSLAFIVVPINRVLLSKFSEFFSRSGDREVRESVKKSINLVTFLYTPVAIGISSIAPTVMILLGGPAYLPGSLALQIISISSAIFISQNILVMGLSGTRHTNTLVMASAFPLISNLVFSVVLIPVFSILGAAISLGSTNAVSFIVIHYYAKKYTLHNFDIRTIAKIWTASIFMFAIVWAIQSWLGPSFLNLFIFLAAGLLSFLVMIKVLRVLKSEDIDFIFSRVPISLGIFKELALRLT